MNENITFWFFFFLDFFFFFFHFFFSFWHHLPNPIQLPHTQTQTPFHTFFICHVQLSLGIFWLKIFFSFQFSFFSSSFPALDDHQKRFGSQTHQSDGVVISDYNVIWILFVATAFYYEFCSIFMNILSFYFNFYYYLILFFSFSFFTSQSTPSQTQKWKKKKKKKKKKFNQSFTFVNIHRKNPFINLNQPWLQFFFNQKKKEKKEVWNLICSFSSLSQKETPLHGPLLCLTTSSLVLFCAAPFGLPPLSFVGHPQNEAAVPGSPCKPHSCLGVALSGCIWRCNLRRLPRLDPSQLFCQCFVWEWNFGDISIDISNGAGC